MAGRLVIEVDGATHITPEQVAHDKRRTAYLEAQGWNVIRCFNEDLYRDVSLVVEDITRRLSPLRHQRPFGP
jgi:very-short-patch-repair endonuclease